MKQIITLQFGNFANHVAAHQWNAYDHLMNDTSAIQEFEFHTWYREGMNLNGQETFTPRILIFDNHENFSTIRQENELYADISQSADPLVWHGDVETMAKDDLKESQYVQELSLGHGCDGTLKDLSSQVQNWTDYNRCFYHPKSFIGCPPYSIMDFLAGREYMSSPQVIDDIYDERFRYFLEDADQLNGIHVLVDQMNGFGGVCSKFLEILRDDIPKIPAMAFGFYDKETLDQNNGQSARMNTSMSSADLIDQTQLYIPIDINAAAKYSGTGHLSCFKNINYNTSALISQAVQQSLLPVGLYSGGIDMGYLTGLVTSMSPCRIGNLSTQFPLKNSGNDLKSVMKDQRSFTEDPVCDLYSQYVVLSGEAFESQNLSDLEMQMAQINKCYGTKALRTKQGYPVKTPFPKIVSTTFDDGAEHNDEDQLQHERVVSSVTTLYSSKSSKLHLQWLKQSLTRPKQLVNEELREEVTNANHQLQDYIANFEDYDL
ncbi:hypothetical protein MP228_009946 [Amoeboaphelidium protococcarum]|nr:hypothetical protein MP228_009946 [Amoeboaphelidium protococcarum]